MKFSKIIGIRWVGCYGNSEKKEDLWLGEGRFVLKITQTWAVLIGVREGIPKRINKTQGGLSG